MEGKPSLALTITITSQTSEVEHATARGGHPPWISSPPRGPPASRSDYASHSRPTGLQTAATAARRTSNSSARTTSLV